MRVLVTGGGGFVGQAVVRELLARGHDVDSASRGAHPELDELGVTSFPVDVRHNAKIDRGILKRWAEGQLS